MKIDQLKKVIQTANPEIMEQPCTHKLMADENGCPFGEHSRPIRLADVLLAYERKNKWRLVLIEHWDNFTRAQREINIQLQKLLRYWNLKDDNLDNQSDDTKQFLMDLLCEA